MITSKNCSNCRKTKKVSNYYINRENKQGYNLDNTCKECAKKICTNLEGLKLYTSLNSRKFSQELYDIAIKSATEKYENDVAYNSLSEEKRESFLFEKISNIYFSRMGQTQYYEFIKNNENVILEDLTDEDMKETEDEYEEDNLDPVKQGKDKKIWSEVWQGGYTKRQIDWLDAYYEDTKKDFNVVSRIHSDYAKKIAKASLNMDEAFNDMMNNVPGADKRYKEAKAVFDSLSQSAKFSEKTRSANDVAGLSSLSEVTEQLEKRGFLQKKMTFEKDDVDKISEDFRHTISSVGGVF